MIRKVENNVITARGYNDQNTYSYNRSFSHVIMKSN